jgi:hypothetical protein
MDRFAISSSNFSSPALDISIAFVAFSSFRSLSFGFALALRFFGSDSGGLMFVVPAKCQKKKEGGKEGKVINFQSCTLQMFTNERLGILVTWNGYFDCICGLLFIQTEELWLCACFALLWFQHFL